MEYMTILNTAKDAALTAGKFLKESFNQQLEIEYKGEINLVTEKDRESQEMIYKLVKDRFPDHSILGEEDLSVEKDKDHLWLIDPIDGTTNFAQSIPMFCVSIAFMEKGSPRVGVVYLPMLDEMFHAVRGSGAFLNNKQIHVSKKTELGKSLLATGFPYDRRESKINNVNHFNKFILRSLCIRRMGSAAIDLCYTAAGRFDGFWELKLFPWDSAAGLLIVEEAGGKVTDFSGNSFNPFLKECLATNGLIHSQMLQTLNE